MLWDAEAISHKRDADTDRRRKKAWVVTWKEFIKITLTSQPLGQTAINLGRFLLARSVGRVRKFHGTLHLPWDERRRRTLLCQARPIFAQGGKNQQTFGEITCSNKKIQSNDNYSYFTALGNPCVSSKSLANVTLYRTLQFPRQKNSLAVIWSRERIGGWMEKESLVKVTNHRKLHPNHFFLKRSGFFLSNVGNGERSVYWTINDVRRRVFAATAKNAFEVRESFARNPPFLLLPLASSISIFLQARTHSLPSKCFNSPHENKFPLHTNAPHFEVYMKEKNSESKPGFNFLLFKKKPPRAKIIRQITGNWLFIVFPFFDRRNRVRTTVVVLFFGGQFTGKKGTHASAYFPKKNITQSRFFIALKHVLLLLCCVGGIRALLFLNICGTTKERIYSRFWRPRKRRIYILGQIRCCPSQFWYPPPPPRKGSHRQTSILTLLTVSFRPKKRRRRGLRSQVTK